jgi:3-oxoacyl-[acyl-carrier-protein] synthase-3
MTTPVLKQSHGVEFTRIYSYGAARGDLVVPNDELVGPIDSSDEWIQQRTGIITRTRASAGLFAVDLATDAAKEATIEIVSRLTGERVSAEDAVEAVRTAQEA